MPYAERQPPKRYAHVWGQGFISFRFGLYKRQKVFLDEYSARLGVTRSGILREALDMLIEKWEADNKFQPEIEDTDVEEAEV